MSKDSSDKAPPYPLPFEVFRSDGSKRLPAHGFSNGETPASTRRSGPVEQRSISDSSGLPPRRDAERKTTSLRTSEDTAAPAETLAAEPVTIRVQTYRVNLAERIARVKAEQKEALDNLQQMEADSRSAGTDSES